MKLNRTICLLVYIVTALIFVYSCRSSAVTGTVKLDETSNNTRDDIIKDIVFVVLEEGENPVIGNIGKVCVKEKIIYVADYERNVIAAFDRSGAFLFSVNRTGRGKGEYLNIQSFTVDDKYLYVLDSFNIKIYVYDALSGYYLYNVAVQVLAWDFEVLDNGGFIFAYAPMSHSVFQPKSMRYRVISTDKDQHISARYFGYERKEFDGFCYGNYFSADGESIVYSSLNQDGFALFDKLDGRLIHTTEFSFLHSLDKGLRCNYDYEKACHYTHATGHAIKCGSIYVIPINVNNSVCDYCFFSRENVIENGNACRIPIFGIVASCPPFLVANWESAGVYNSAIARGIPKAPSDIEEKIKKGYPYLVFYDIDKKYL